MPFEFIKNNLEKVGCVASVNEDCSEISIEHDDDEYTVTVSEEWQKEVRLFLRSNQYEYDVDERRLIGPRTLEMMVAPLGGEYFYKPNYSFTSKANREVTLTTSSEKFRISFFASNEYEKYFEAIVSKRLKKRKSLTFETLLWAPTSITYKVPKKQDKSKLLHEGIPTLEACLFKLASEKNECWEFKKRLKKKFLSYSDEAEDEALTIPTATYEVNLIKYYKVAISSQFPSQSFLAFYHILEYNFLQVSDEVLQGRLKSHIHDTRFQGRPDQIDKIISIVKKHSSSSDETEMLLRVLRKYVDEDELIEFIKKYEERAGDAVFSKSKEIFGEKLNIQLRSDHALSNTAKLIKHIRNALVHSSDRYNRDDCHIPLTESEFLVREYIPLVRFLSERVIYAKSS
ncbi:hypothetical protein [Pseudomonas sediminis]|uniref:ApeA N-terminal domain-containing protein n=1 Tax=Pseudomonas sediminis TaxID=1691904 RepID=A0ABX6SQA8_9PSED|nr:hypothetical protein [Pseudomonas sediminis]QNH03232.1 hypothetical protein HNQ25_11040 [Pseudomonas sediminis]